MNHKGGGSTYGANSVTILPGPNIPLFTFIILKMKMKINININIKQIPRRKYDNAKHQTTKPTRRACNATTTHPSVQNMPRRQLRINPQPLCILLPLKSSHPLRPPNQTTPSSLAVTRDSLAPALTPNPQLLQYDWTQPRASGGKREA